MLQEKINFEDAKNKAHEFIKRNGPSIPSQVARVVNIPPLFTSALLSQLIAEKHLRVSHLKIGGSPLYYREEQKDKLLEFINHLPSLEKDICTKLQREGVIVDEKVSLAEKVALRNIKDFAIALSVKIGDGKKIVWKWFSLPEQDVMQKIGGLLKTYQVEAKTEIKSDTKPEVTEAVEEREEGEEKIAEEEQEGVEIKRDYKPEIRKKIRIQGKQVDFLEEIKKFLAANKVKIMEEKLIRKNSEIELVLQLTSSLGKMNFFAIAKNKKVINPADVTLVHYRGQEKKLPLIFLSSGKFTKKAEEKANELGITLKSLKEKI